MGTNYYHHEKPACPSCGHQPEEGRRHIGKSSMGWCFSLHVYPEDGINRLEDWMARWATGEIRDEYGDLVSPDDMRKRITDRKRERSWDDERQWIWYGDEATFHSRNHSQRGPNGMLRHQIDGRHCVGHGEGTWDHIVGEFC